MVGETLQVQDQKLRGLVDLHLFESGLVSFALRTVPFVVACQGLILAETGQTVVERDGAFSGYFGLRSGWH